jgi:hypothetical protein
MVLSGRGIVEVEVVRQFVEVRNDEQGFHGAPVPLPPSLPAAHTLQFLPQTSQSSV